MKKIVKTEKFNYTPELREVIKIINDVKKTQTFANVSANEPNERLAKALRTSYKTALQFNLLNLHAALGDWISAGGKIEEEPWKS